MSCKYNVFIAESDFFVNFGSNTQNYSIMKSNLTFSTFIPTRLLFGCGEIARLATEKLPGKKALVVISAGTSMKKYGYLDKVVSLLAQGGVESVVYDKILPNPVRAHVMEAAGVCRSEGCDFVVGLGGGSSVDSAKAIAVMACNDGDYWDYVNAGSGKGRPVAGALPIVAIPTTAGTGTEADPWAVITNEELHEKIGFGGDFTFPVLSIVDPELMVSVPAKFTALQGFDAFFHASEGYIANCSTPVSDLYALEAVRLLAKYLPEAVANGGNLKARTKVALASMLAGMVESTSSCTSEHSMEHAMSAFCPELPHGAGLIALSDAYFSAFRTDCVKRYMKMAEAMTGHPSSAPEDFLVALRRMQKSCGVDDIKVSDWGVRREDLPAMVQNARHTMGGLFGFDPRPLTDDEVLDIYRMSYR